MGSAFSPILRRAQRYVVFRNWRTADKEAPVVHLRSWDRPRVSFPTINGEVASPTRGGMDGRNRAVRINGACVAQRVAASVGCWRCSRSPRAMAVLPPALRASGVSSTLWGVRRTLSLLRPNQLLSVPLLLFGSVATHALLTWSSRRAIPRQHLILSTRGK